MPPPIEVALLPHDPRWLDNAIVEAQSLSRALGSNLLVVHHVGSTKPILDLMPVVGDLTELDKHQCDVEALGYKWWGEFGLPGRRYCTKTDRQTGRRMVQLHCYADGSSEITRHLAFRDYLRAQPRLAAEYDRVKAECRHLHPGNSHDYSDCKAEWIRKTEMDALAWYNGR